MWTWSSNLGPNRWSMYSLVSQIVIRFWSGAVGQQAWGHLELFMTVHPGPWYLPCHWEGGVPPGELSP